MGDPREERRRSPHRVAVRRRLQAAATPHLAVDLQNSLDFVRDLDCSSPGLKWEESTQVVLDDYWHNMAEGGRRCIVRAHGQAVEHLLPSRSLGRVSDQSGDVAVL